MDDGDTGDNERGHDGEEDDGNYTRLRPSTF